MLELSEKKFVIREIFAMARKKASIIGEDNVFDFSIGNPNTPTPKSVHKAIELANNDLPKVTVHGYSNASGDESVKSTLIDNLNQRFNMKYSKADLFLTCGAAAAITISLKALINPGEEVIILAPYYPEYSSFVQCSGADSIVVMPNADDFQPSLANIEAAITPMTKALIINSPNNPSGVVYTREILEDIGDLLRRKSEEYGHIIYIISDEPYREVIYDNVEVPYIPKIYDHTIICYSYSKSLSIPGHRVGYILMPYNLRESDELHAAIPSAARILGYVQAPTLSQLIVKQCVGITANMDLYRRNRDLLYGHLMTLGFNCFMPQGAFYLLLKSPTEDVDAFILEGTHRNLFFANGSAFGCNGYVRLSFCMSNEKLEASLPYFTNLAEHYNLKEAIVS